MDTIMKRGCIRRTTGRKFNRTLSSLIVILALAAVDASPAVLAQAPFEMVIKGGHVIDPKNNVDGVRDVAIADGKIARVAADIPVENVRQVIPAKGLYVVPGLIDVHVHVYVVGGVPRLEPGRFTGNVSVAPDDHSFRNGVTTMVDAGTCGARTFEDFKRRVIDNAKTRVLAWLNIVGTGIAEPIREQNKEEMDAEFAGAMARRYSDVIVGIKTAHYAGPEWIAVERAVEAGKLADIPVMVDFGRFPPERPYQQLVLEKLRPGDVSTHMYLPAVPLLDSTGKLQPYLFEARKRGVRFDVGHGGGSFVWRQAVPAVQQGWVPDTISTDLHVGSMNAGMKSMTNCMSKFLALGVPLKEVIRMSTSAAADQIRRPPLGNLDVGAPADVTLLRLDEGDFGFLDVRNNRLKGRQRLDCELTLMDGKVMWDLNGRASPDWNSPAANRGNRR
jgi:dihydroorotase